MLSRSPVSIFPLFFVAPGIIGGVQYFLDSTQVCFDRNSFEIKKQLFDLTYYRYKAVTRHIQDVSIEYDTGGTNPVGVTITLVPYLNRFIKSSFGGTLTGQLTEAELIWLTQEIRDWLQAQKLEEPRH